MKLTRSKEDEQSVSFYFSENATIFSNKIKFVNQYNDLNEKVKCKLSKKNETIINCTGLFDFAGEYKIADDKGVFLTSLSLDVVPADGEKYDINNLLETKVNLDDFRMLPTLHFPASVLGDVKKESILVIETGELSLKPSYRTMYLFKGETSSVFHFNATDVNANVAGDGGITLSEKESAVKIHLTGVYKELLKRGFTLKGYGFSANAVYLDKEKPKKEEVEDEE